MFRTLYYSKKIDIYYSLNSIIYYLRKLPIFKDLMTDNIYKSNIIKVIFGIFSILFSIIKKIIFKGIYFIIIFNISINISSNPYSFFHVFFIFSIIGMLIHNSILNSNIKNYLSINIFNMDAKDYVRSILFFNCLSNFIFNFIFLYMFSNNLYTSVLLSVLQVFLRIIGESIDISYYRKNNKLWVDNTFLYFTILIALLLISCTPLVGFVITDRIIIISLFLCFIISIISLIYLNNIKDYKIILKRMNSLDNIMNNDDSRYNFVDVNDKDIKIDSKKINNKNGYDFFNTIFFERHKDILLRSSRNYSIIIFIVYVVLAILCFKNSDYSKNIELFLNNRLGWFVLIMYFINRGSIVTQAMFYNCDHAMLEYNFYREPKVIVGLFKKRLETIIKINLIPSIIIGIGNITLLIIVGNYNVFNIIFGFLFIIFLSIFFSLHYLVMYYLLQPYDKDLKVRKISYSIVSILTYYVCFKLSSISFSSFIFSIIGLLFTVVYIIIGVKLVEKKAPLTFKIYK